MPEAAVALGEAALEHRVELIVMVLSRCCSITGDGSDFVGGR